MQVSEFQKWLSSAYEKYKESKTLLAESKNDPPQEPYRSKYKAKEFLSLLLLELEKEWDKESDMKISLIWALFKYDLGVIALETEEYSIGCDFLTECWEVLEKFAMQPECCILTLSVLNQLGILWSGRGEPSKALIFLKKAEDIYHNYKNSCTSCPLLLEDIFDANIIPKSDWRPFEKIFTLTLYYLAQVYEHLSDSEKSAKYCHMTLKRQKESEEYEEKEWSVNCATLSQYYIQEKKFLTARHLLACSTSTLTKYEASIDNRVDSEDVWDDIHRSKAEVAWCWLKYCINLLFEYQTAGENVEKESENIDPSCKLSDEADVHVIEKQVPFLIGSFQDARQIFLFGQNQVKEAKLYYTLTDHANNHVQLIQDHSKLYKHLIFYEYDLSRQCRMHKRRLDMLEDVLFKLNPQYYLAVCRQLRFELGETYYELIDLKLKIANSPQEMVLSTIKKINSLITRSIEHFKGFIESLKDHEKVFPDVFADDLVRPALIAHFYLGGLYSKLIESDTQKKLHNLSKSEENYKFILNYTEKNPDHVNYIDKELPVIKEMIQLMPEKFMQVAGSTLF